MKIAVIGWGSLLWDLDVLAGNVTGGWNFGTGPALPLEFSRISPKRKHGLVVIIDPVFGIPCPTSYIHSKREDVGDAAMDLAERERAPIERIGYARQEAGERECSVTALDGILTDWLVQESLDACVWTDLPANFEEHVGETFSINRAVKYLKSLEPASLAEAKRYIENAPAETVTPLRTALAANDWWQSLTIEK